VQVDPIKPTLKAPGTKRLKLKYAVTLSNLGFKFNLRRYHRERGTRVCIVEVGCGTSTHSMREESELLLARSLAISIVRIDPGDASVPLGRGVGIKAGGLEALVAIEAAFASQSRSRSSRRRGAGSAKRSRVSSSS
jgi:hypothetical protein